jgi:ribosomal protein L37E
MSAIYTKVSDDLNAVLDQMSEERKAKKSDLIRQLLEDGLETQELRKALERSDAAKRELEGKLDGIKMASEQEGERVVFQGSMEQFKQTLAEGIREAEERGAQALAELLEKKLAHSVLPHEKSEDIDAHMQHCVDCAKKAWESFDKAKFQCSGCGMPFPFDESVMQKEDFKCPDCGLDAYTDRKKS